MEVRKIFEYALQREFEGKKFFLDNAERLSHAAAVSAFKELAAEEQRHIEFIQRHLASMDAGTPASSDALKAELEAKGYFSHRASTEMLDQTVLEAMVPDLPVLRLAYLIEKDFAEFYDKMAAQADGEAKAVLLMLGHWERSHETLFKMMYDRAFEAYADMPWGG
jgi:rubrerythrin